MIIPAAMETSRGFVLKKGAFSVGDILKGLKIAHLGRLLVLLANNSLARLAFGRLRSLGRGWLGIVIIDRHLEDTIS